MGPVAWWALRRLGTLIKTCNAESSVETTGAEMLLPAPAPGSTLSSQNQRVYEKPGIVALEYDVVRSG